MSIEQTNVVDFLTVDHKTGNVVLVVSDHLPWDEQGLHLKLLQDKLNSYLAFIEGGQLYEDGPKAIGHPIRSDQPVAIEVVAKFPLSKEAKRFYELATSAIRNAGFNLQFRLFRPDEEAGDLASPE